VQTTIIAKIKVKIGSTILSLSGLIQIRIEAIITPIL